MIKPIHIFLLTVVFTLLPLLNVGTADETISNVSGKYVREAEDGNAKLEVKQLPSGKVHVTGLSLWGSDRSSGPNIGELNFIAEIKNGRVNYSDKMGKGRYYKLELQFHENGITAKEENALGYFGMNVTFKGEYRKK